MYRDLVYMKNGILLNWIFTVQPQVMFFGPYARVSGAPLVAQRNPPTGDVHIAGGVGDASKGGLPQTGGAFR